MAKFGAPINAGVEGIRRSRAIAPSNSTDLPLGVCAAVWVGVTGDVAIIAEDDTDAVTWTNVPVGFLIVRAKRVLETGTTATGLIAGYN